jgi:hypothetical protein
MESIAPIAPIAPYSPITPSVSLTARAPDCRAGVRPARPLAGLALAAGLLGLGACTHAATTPSGTPAPEAPASEVRSLSAPSPDPRVGLKAGLTDAGEAAWNLKVLSQSPPSKDFIHGVNSDLAFTGKYVIQGSFKGYQVWDISDPTHPTLAQGFVCPASQSDVSVYKNLLIVSGEDLAARLDCGAEGVKETVSKDRLRGVRIFDISDIAHPKNVGNVQTCRGSHTHSLYVDPKDPDNVYVYISGSSGVRPAAELPGCSNALPSEDPNSALFRIEVIKIPVAHPEQAAIVSSPRIFNDLVAPAKHGLAPEDVKEIDEAKKQGKIVVEIPLAGIFEVLPDQFVKPRLDSIVKARGGTGDATGADTAAFRAMIDKMVASMMGTRGKLGPTQCHDITLYPAIGLGGGACEGYGMLLDISDPSQPRRIAAVSDSNFSYWHSATITNDGTKALFSDEWGGGGQPKCRETDPRDWGADAIFTIDAKRQLHFASYYKLPAPQTSLENCVAHNGSLIPIPGRDVMVQAWYQGGISVFDFTDAAHPQEIAFFDRGPIDSTHMELGGSWSAYWYNGAIYSSEIVRGLDVFQLTPSPLLSQNEIDAARTVKFDYLNVQGQPKLVWPASFALARAYTDQLERSNGLASARITAVRGTLDAAEHASGGERQAALGRLAGQLSGEAGKSRDAARVRLLAGAVRDLASSSAQGQ